MAKLSTIRLISLALTWLGSKIGPKTYRGACQWLYTFLLGRGGKVKIPTHYVEECMDDFLYALQDQEGGVKPEKWYELRFNHSTLYKGSGFSQRPSLFYMIGGFTGYLYLHKTGGISIRLQDVYDWHPVIQVVDQKRQDYSFEYLVSWEEQEETFEWRAEVLEWEVDKCYGPPPEKPWVFKEAWVSESYEEYSDIKKEFWFCSGFNLPSWLDKALNKLLGEEYYPLEGFPLGNPGFSNKLWADLEKVGAKPFLSVVDTFIDYKI